MLSGNSPRQTVHTHCASVHQAAKSVAALLRVAKVTAGLAESNGSLPLGLWLMSLAGWLPRAEVIEYGLPLPFYPSVLCPTICNQTANTDLLTVSRKITITTNSSHVIHFRLSMLHAQQVSTHLRLIWLLHLFTPGRRCQSFRQWCYLHLLHAITLFLYLNSDWIPYTVSAVYHLKTVCPKKLGKWLHCHCTPTFCTVPTLYNEPAHIPVKRASSHGGPGPSSNNKDSGA